MDKQGPFPSTDGVGGDPQGPTADAHPCPRPFGLRRDEWGRLVLVDANGLRHVGVEAVRAFPFSDPHRGIALCDAEGREVAWVDDPSTLSSATRALLEEELTTHEFVPVLRRIVHIHGDATPADWDVETDRGMTRFTLKAEEDVRRLGDHATLVVDAHGIRYLIPDIRVLDGHSRRLLERYA